MEIEINSVHFVASGELESFVMKKITKLERFFEKITKVNVFLKLEKPDSKSNKQVEIKLIVPGQELFAEKQADTFEEAVDLVVEALKKQIEKYKEKKM